MLNSWNLWCRLPTPTFIAVYFHLNDIIYRSCPEARSFESCWNFLLYLVLHFLLISLQNPSLTVRKIVVPWYTNIASEDQNFGPVAAENNKSLINKLVTHNAESCAFMAFTDASGIGLGFFLPSLKLAFQCPLPSVSALEHIFFFEILAQLCGTQSVKCCNITVDTFETLGKCHANYAYHLYQWARADGKPIHHCHVHMHLCR